jgi:hypothetical protein
MERTTQTLTTPSGNSVVIYAYATAGDVREFNKLIYAYLKMQGGEVKFGEQNTKEGMTLQDIPATVMLEQQEKILELMVVSVDGNITEPKKALLNLKPEDCDFVLEACSPFFGKAKNE